MNGLIQVGEWCKTPAWWAMDVGIHAFVPLRPGEYGQSESKACEVFKRVISCLICLIALPLILTSLVVGISLHFIGYKCCSKPYLYYKSNCKEALDQKNLSVLTLNACDMPGGLSLLHGGVAKTNRIDALAQEILKANPDVVCLEEMHSIGDDFAMVSKLEGNYTHFYFNIGHQTIFFDSGLFIASKRTMKHPDFTPFSTVVDTHVLANKGVFQFEVSGTHIFHTHLLPSEDIEARPNDHEINVREKELNLIAKKIEALEDQSAPIMVVGDFNIVKGSAEYRRQEVLQRFQDSAPDAVTWRQFGPTVDSPEEPVTLDYSLLWKMSKVITFTTKLFRTYNSSCPGDSLSDHEGLLSELTW